MSETRETYLSGASPLEASGAGGVLAGAHPPELAGAGKGHMAKLDTVDAIFDAGHGLLAELASSQDSTLTKTARTRAVQNVRHFVSCFKNAGLVVRFYNADCQPINLGKSIVAFVMVFEAVARGPLAGGFVTWPVEDPKGPEDALLQVARELLREPRIRKSRYLP